MYSASTVASDASDEMLAIIRGESQRGFPAAPGLPKNLKLDPKSDPKIAVRSDAKPDWRSELPDMRATAPPPPQLAPQAIKAPTPAAGAPPPPPSATGSKPAYTSTPLEVPVTNLTATTDPPRSVEIAPDPEPAAPSSPPPASIAAKTEDDDPNFRKGTLHPAVGILLFFVAVFAVLAALIR